MAINLLQLQPHKVSRDLSGYMTYIYGPGGAGKTTFGVATPKPLLLAFEKGYNALPGVIAQDVTSWGDVKQILRELKKPEVKALFQTIVVDTVDIASALCEKYLCSQLGIENIGDGGWTTNGWAKVKKEWEATWRAVTMEGYALVFIAHSKDKTFTRKDGSTYNQIVPSCSTAYNEIIKNMVDIMAYIDVEGGQRKLVMRSSDDSIECKCRFKHITPVINFSYQSLVDALNDAIDAEAKATNGEFVTNEKQNTPVVREYDFDALQSEFGTIVGDLMAKNQLVYAPKVTQIVEKYLGKGRRASEATPDQAELLYLIVTEIKEDLV
jgi:hypothetical protein